MKICKIKLPSLNERIVNYLLKIKTKFLHYSDIDIEVL